MVLRKSVLGWVICQVLIVGLPVADVAAEGRADGEVEAWAAKEKGEVTLPLAEYLRLVEVAEAAREKAEQEAETQVPPSATWISQHVELTVPESAADGVEVATLRATLSAKVVGDVQAAGAFVALPLDGWPARLSLTDKSTDAVWASQSGQRRLWFKKAGTYEVKVEGRVAVVTAGRSKRLRFPEVVAPSARVSVDLPANREWSLDGVAVELENTVEAGERRRLSFAVASGRPWLKMEGPAASGSQRLLASSVVATVIQLQRTGRLRHDMAVFEVSRGELDTLRLDLPAGVEVDRAVTDEGAVEWIDPALRRLELPRREPLAGRGYVAAVSTLSGRSDRVSLAPITTEVPTRAHYLAVVGPVPALAEPPADAWLRVDADDLPAELGQALGVADLVTVWRRIEGREPGELRIVTLPDAPRLESQARQRTTTTLLTVDGTLLHRDELYIKPVGSVLEWTLPEGAVLWSAEVGGQAVRPIERDGKLLLPLSLADPDGDTVELVTVLERAVPAGRSSLSMALPELTLPVLEHRWQVLLPWENQYRLRSATLSPVPSSQRLLPATIKEGRGPSLFGTVVDEDGEGLPGVTVTVESEGRRQATVADASGAYKFFDLDTGRRRRSWTLTAELEGFSSVSAVIEVQRGHVAQYDVEMAVASVAEEIVVTAEVPTYDEAEWRDQLAKNESRVVLDAYRSNVAGLEQGLVGGVRPVPVSIPTEGKVLNLIGVLPSGPVTLQLDVKGGR